MSKSEHSPTSERKEARQKKTQESELFLLLYDTMLANLFSKQICNIFK